MTMLNTVNAQVKDPERMVYATIGGPETMDPHWSYDTASGEIIFQVYDNLIAYDGESIEKFVPMLALQVPSEKNGLIKYGGIDYIFPIRYGVRFHNGALMTPEDIEYSFERGMIFDRAGGPCWMLLEPLLGVGSIEELAVKLAGVENYGDMFKDEELLPEYKEAMIKVYTDYVDRAVEVQGNNVVFHLAQPYAPFLNILAHGGGWASIINKEWSIQQGAWDGKADTWWLYHDPQNEEDPLYDIANGTGPFKLVRWVPEEIIMLERFEEHWRGPAQLKEVVYQYVNEWTTRKLMLQRGDADIVYVPVTNMQEVMEMEGVELIAGLPTLSNTVTNMPWTLNAEGNANLGSGKLDGEGIPPDFFSDIHVRKGFSYLFPYDIFIEKSMHGQAKRNPGPFPDPLYGYTDDPELYYEFNIEKAKEEFQQAWGGELWEKGCKFNIFYNEGNDVRKTACDMISTYAKIVNPKFELTPVGVQWSSYLKQFLAEQLPMYTIGWLADYPHPHNWAPTYLGSNGTYSAYYGKAYTEWAKENVDPLIDKALKSTDPKEQESIYLELTKIAHDQAVALYLYQPIGIHVQRDWVKGWYFNPVISGLPEGADFYYIYKE
uniref:ABC-type dipeptide transport system periplasmic component n=1 Tax=uncultured Atribacterota bacterium TaxID=263865 RepID=G3BMN1_9BACT|nr:ABC-type dipeptide transport system periplasmic component [uncultured Atribacterota bacterium]